MMSQGRVFAGTGGGKAWHTARHKGGEGQISPKDGDTEIESRVRQIDRQKRQERQKT